MNRNDRTLAGLAWLAATMPTLVQQDCLKGDEITSISATGWDVSIQMNDYYAAERIAARLGIGVKYDMSSNFRDGREYEQKVWGGYDGGVEVAISYCARIHVPTECMDEVTA